MALPPSSGTHDAPLVFQLRSPIFSKNRGSSSLRARTSALGTPQPSRERLRHLVIGSPQGVRSTIHILHALNYADPTTWSRLLAIPESGIVITPAQGEVLSYLVRWRQLG